MRAGSRRATHTHAGDAGEFMEEFIGASKKLQQVYGHSLVVPRHQHTHIICRSIRGSVSI